MYPMMSHEALVGGGRDTEEAPFPWPARVFSQRSTMYVSVLHVISYLISQSGITIKQAWGIQHGVVGCSIKICFNHSNTDQIAKKK